MRAGNTGGPLGPLEPTVRAVEAAFLDAIKHYTKPFARQVMLGDATVTTQDTFDADGIGRMFGSVAASLPRWQARDVTTTTNDGIRRVFVKFSANIGTYTISGHMSLQFHVLLYYVPDHRVVECRKDLDRVIEEAKSGEAQLASASDAIVAANVLGPDERDVSEQELFERLYADDSLLERIGSDLDGAMTANLRRLSETKTRLIRELDGLLTETYQTVPILIDDVRLATGEEGCLCTFDVEMPGGMPEEIEYTTLEDMRGLLDEVLSSMRSQMTTP